MAAASHATPSSRKMQAKKRKRSGTAVIDQANNYHPLDAARDGQVSEVATTVQMRDASFFDRYDKQARQHGLEPEREHDDPNARALRVREEALQGVEALGGAELLEHFT